MKAFVSFACSLLCLASVVSSFRVEVSPEFLRDTIAQELVALDTMKIQTITDMKYNKNIDIEYLKVAFVGVSDQAFDVEVKGSTRKGPGQVIAEFTARVRYEIMPSPTFEFSL